MIKKLKKIFHSIEDILHTIVGAPSYHQYVIHIQTHHPEESILSEKAFYRKAMENRYNDGKIRRCC